MRLSTSRSHPSGSTRGVLDFPSKIPEYDANFSAVLWGPQRLQDFIAKDKLVGTVSVNPAQNILYFVLREEGEVEWGKVKGFVDRAYDLYVLFWDSQRKLLFINTSNNDASHEAFAKVVAGDNAELIKGSQVFRVFGGLNRLLLQTLGLSHTVTDAVLVREMAVVAVIGIGGRKFVVHLRNKNRSSMH